MSVSNTYLTGRLPLLGIFYRQVTFLTGSLQKIELHYGQRSPAHPHVSKNRQKLRSGSGEGTSVSKLSIDTARLSPISTQIAATRLEGEIKNRRLPTVGDATF